MDFKERLKQQPPSPGQNRARLEDEEAVVYQLLSDQPTPIDELIVKRLSPPVDRLGQSDQSNLALAAIHLAAQSAQPSRSV